MMPMKWACDMTIDFHSHVLPGIDDGSSCLEESLALMAMQAKQGVTHTVATPHFYPRHQRFDEFLGRRQEAEGLLRQALEGKEGLPELTVGAEVHFFSGIGNCEELKQLTIGAGRFILIEMPHGEWSRRMYQDLEDISGKQDLTPIIAHVDRYMGSFSSHGIPEKLMDAGCLIQANASAFLSAPGSALAMRLLKKGCIHLLGSDCHSVDTRPPKIGPALEKIRGKLGEEFLSQMARLGESILFGT